MWLAGLVAPQHVGSSQTRARTRVPCIGRQILNHCTTREALHVLFNLYYTDLFKNSRVTSLPCSKTASSFLLSLRGNPNSFLWPTGPACSGCQLSSCLSTSHSSLAQDALDAGPFLLVLELTNCCSCLRAFALSVPSALNAFPGYPHDLFSHTIRSLSELLS